MDIIKFVVRSVMRGEVHLFSHRFSVSMQLIHGQPQVGATPETTTYEQTVITKYAPRYACRVSCVVCRVSCVVSNTQRDTHATQGGHRALAAQSGVEDEASLQKAQARGG